MTNKKFLNLVNFSDVWGNNLLLLAIENNDINNTKLLLQAGYDLNHINKKKQNALTLAYRLSDKTILKEILPSYEAQFTTEIKNSLLSLLKSEDMQYLSLYKLELNQSSPDVLPLHQAIENTDLALIKNLLKEGVDVNCVNSQGQGALSSLRYSKFRKQTDIINLLELFKEYGYDFKRFEKNVDFEAMLSTIVLDMKPTQKIFNYMYNEGWEFKVYNGEGRYRVSTPLYNIVKHIKLNTEQIQKIFVDSVNEDNYSSISLNNIYIIQNEKGELTNQAFFDVINKIEINNWPLMKTIASQSEYQSDKKYNLLYQIMSMNHYSISFDKEHSKSEMFSFKNYLLNMGSEDKYSQIISKIHHKTDFHQDTQFLYFVLKNYSMAELGITLTAEDMQKTFQYGDSYDLKTANLNLVLHELLGYQYKGEQRDKLKELLNTGLFNIYEKRDSKHKVEQDSFLCRVVRGFTEDPETFRYDDKRKIKNASYQLFLVICENYAIDLKHKDVNGVSIDKHIKNYIQTLNNKEEAELLLFNISLQKNTQTTKKVKI
jgi:hypothetical protein